MSRSLGRRTSAFREPGLTARLRSRPTLIGKRSCINRKSSVEHIYSSCDIDHDVHCSNVNTALFTTTVAAAIRIL